MMLIYFLNTFTTQTKLLQSRTDIKIACINATESSPPDEPGFKWGLNTSFNTNIC